MASIPHGGSLISRYLRQEQLPNAKKRAAALPSITLRERDVDDMHMIASGAFSPLRGFMGVQDYRKVVANMRLDNGLPWSIPVVLPVSDEDRIRIQSSHQISLTFNQEPIALLTISEVFERDPEWEALQVYGTTDPNHPGVSVLMQEPKNLVGGTLDVFYPRERSDLDKHLLTPKEVRERIAQEGWKKIVAFQTRNPIHRAHEYLQKCALEYVDGLLIHPIVGETKKGDLPADVRMKAYELALSNYYPKDRVMLATMKTAMRYAGPREAIFHALIRKNYGCTHFIVGRDHAGVGDYYDSFAAHHIFDEFNPDELGITPIRFDHAFYCKKCYGMSTAKTCPHTDEDRVILSGTKVREMLRQGHCPPPEFTRPEIAELLVKYSKDQK